LHSESRFYWLEIQQYLNQSCIRVQIIKEVAVTSLKETNGHSISFRHVNNLLIEDTMPLCQVSNYRLHISSTCRYRHTALMDCHTRCSFPRGAQGYARYGGLVSDHARAEKMFPGPNRLLLCCWWEHRVSRLFGCEHLVQGFVRHLDSVRLHFRNYCNGCIDFLQIKAQQDCFIVEWAPELIT